jgi:hypothetical protein
MRGIGPELDHLLHMVCTAQGLFGDGAEWPVLAAGVTLLDTGDFYGWGIMKC